MTETSENPYTENPNPEVVNNYYYDEGPPVVTYYPPPVPYDYLYSWVPYPFWSRAFFFPGFFILHDFHRHFVFHGHRVVVTDHVARGDSKKLSAVDPVSRTLGGSRVPKWVALRRPFDSPRAQSSARTIRALDQSRFVSAGVPTTPRLSGVTSSLSMAKSPWPTRANRSTLTGRRSLPRSNIGPAQVSGRRTGGAPAVGRRYFGWPQPRPFVRHSLSQGSGVSLSRTDPRSSFGGMHGGRDVGGLRGSSGGSRGGRR